MAWLRMRTAGYEADKNDIILDIDGKDVNLTRHWDGTVNSFRWSTDGNRIYFNAPVDGTVQLFEIAVSNQMDQNPDVRQITKSTAHDKQYVIGIHRTLIPLACFSKTLDFLNH